MMTARKAKPTAQDAQRREMEGRKLITGPFKGRLIRNVSLLDLDRMTRHPDVKRADRSAIKAYLALPAVATDLRYDIRFGKKVVEPDVGCNEP